MLKSAIDLCPDELWQKKNKFFYLSYHTAIFLDYYLTCPVKNFQPALPYTITAENKIPIEAIDDILPNELYSRQQLLAYLSSAREKCKQLVFIEPDNKLTNPWIEKTEINMHGLCPSLVENYTILEILFYNLRHVQHHTAQLNFILRQEINKAPDWISLAD
ncbi:MAG: DinB family protein [Bacteroidetes bacterium]|nr:DinB family protein [Bacteroidota bacterium]